MPTGGASCSVILTCLEVLQAGEKQNSENGIAYSLHFALLYQYARQKVWRSFSVLIVSRGNWLGKPANIKAENNGAVVYVGSSLTVHNPLCFVRKLWLNKLMRCFYWSVSLKW